MKQQFIIWVFLVGLIAFVTVGLVRFFTTDKAHRNYWLKYIVNSICGLILAWGILGVGIAFASQVPNILYDISSGTTFNKLDASFLVLGIILSIPLFLIVIFSGVNKFELIKQKKEDREYIEEQEKIVKGKIKKLLFKIK